MLSILSLILAVSLYRTHGMITFKTVVLLIMSVAWALLGLYNYTQLKNKSKNFL